MKKGLIFILGVIPFFCVQLAYAGWPGECYVTVLTPGTQTTTGNSTLIQVRLNQSNGFLFQAYYSDLQENTKIYGTLVTKYFENGSWSTASTRNYYYNTLASDLNIVSSLPSSCPSDCSSQESDLIDNCGPDNWVWIDESICSGECICNPDTMQSALDTCNEGGNPADINYNTCTVTCDECADEKAALIEECGVAGTINVGLGGCGGRCRNCNDYWNDAAEECSNRGGIDDGFCQESDGKIVYQKAVTCKSEVINPPEEEEDPLEGPQAVPDKPSDTTPKDDPTTTPDPAATDTHDEVAAAWLDAIKGNTDNLIDQGNNTNDILDNIASNMATSVDNQVKIGDAFNELSNSMNALGATMSSLNNKTEYTTGDEDSGTDLTGVEEKLDTLNSQFSTDGVDFSTVQDTTDYTSDQYKITDSEIQGEYGKTDAELRAKLDEIDTYDQSFDDFIKNTQVRLSGSNACIDGAVMGSNFNFCFDGYQGIWLSMGQLMLAMSYIQAFFIIVGRK